VTSLATDPFTMLIIAILGALWLLIGGIAALCCVSSAALRRRRERDMEALIEATWEASDHAPTAWTEEFRR